MYRSPMNLRYSNVHVEISLGSPRTQRIVAHSYEIPNKIEMSQVIYKEHVKRAKRDWNDGCPTHSMVAGITAG